MEPSEEECFVANIHHRRGDSVESVGEKHVGLEDDTGGRAGVDQRGALFRIGPSEGGGVHTHLQLDLIVRAAGDTNRQGERCGEERQQQDRPGREGTRPVTLR